jgi:hypothetical protein
MFTAGLCFPLQTTHIFSRTCINRYHSKPIIRRSNIRVRLLYLGGIDLWPEGHPFRESDPRAWGIKQASAFQLTLKFRWPLDGRKAEYSRPSSLSYVSQLKIPIFRPFCADLSEQSRNRPRFTSNESLPTTLYHHSRCDLILHCSTQTVSTVGCLIYLTLTIDKPVHPRAAT